MASAYFIPAIGTPLTEDECLHEEGLEAHLSDVAASGISAIFTAGSMGAMPLLREETYRHLVRRSVELWRGRGEILAGAGDTGYARTRDRIQFLNEFPLDGVVALNPYFWKFSQEELIDYYGCLAKESRAPLYLYDLPQVVGYKVAFETVVELAKTPNIKGIKCSDEPGYARRITDYFGDRFRVIIAQPNLVDTFLHHGMREHLDGMYAIAPRWAMEIGRCADRQDWAGAAQWQQRLTRLWDVARQGISACSLLMNARGIPGNFAPRPFKRLDDEQRSKLLENPTVKELIGPSAV
jgi:4-hydroxy-tetrahydrodipicolinate synthase